MIFIEGSHWRTTFEYCRRCPYIHDAHAKSHKR